MIEKYCCAALGIFKWDEILQSKTYQAGDGLGGDGGVVGLDQPEQRRNWLQQEVGVHRPDHRGRDQHVLKPLGRFGRYGLAWKSTS